MNSTSIDNAIVDVDIWSDPDRYAELFGRLRRDDPVRWTEPDGYRPFWTVSKHADIAEVQSKPKQFLSGPRSTLNTIESEQLFRMAAGRESLQKSIISADGDEHKALREITREWFLPPNVRKIEDDIRAIADRHVDLLVEKGRRCDFVGDVAVWYPLRVILRIFGLSGDAAAEANILRLSKELNGTLDKRINTDTSPGEHMMRVVEEMFATFRPLVEERRRNPRDDLASVIANAKVDGEYLDDLTVFSYYISITVAGHDTTSASIAGGMLALIERPDEMAKLRANPKLLRMAVDEMVRWTHPVKHFFRTAVEDYDLRGKRVRAGDALLMCYPSACRDAEVFEDPFAFRVDRSPNPHLAFGIGSHVCLGQFLAKQEMMAFFSSLLARIEDIRLDGDPVQTRTLFMGGLRALPIRYSVVGRPAGPA